MVGPLDTAAQRAALRTWRYLRLAMVAVVVAIGVAVLHEHLHTHPRCFQPSISAYYYTPARNVLVGGLVTIGVCLYCLRGAGDVDDVLLNLAGVLAPLVAFVPIPDTGTCATVLAGTAGRATDVATDVTALLAVDAAALALVAVLHLFGSPGGGRVGRVGYGVAVLLWLLATGTFLLARPTFLHLAHYVAAVLMFTAILGVVVLTALRAAPASTPRRMRNRYGLIAALMVGAAVVSGVAGLLHWAYWIIVLEAALIVLFAVFWVLQTVQGWRAGPG